MKIKSKTDVITNSSSETFVIRPDKGQTVDELLEDLERVHKEQEVLKKDFYSGDCQDIELLGMQKIHKKLYWPKIILDRGFIGTKEYIQETYHVQGHEYWG